MLIYQRNVKLFQTFPYTIYENQIAGRKLKEAEEDQSLKM